MNKKLFFMAIVLFCACTNTNKPLDDATKDSIVGEVKGVISTIIQNCENPNPEELKSIFLNSPDFIGLVGGVYADYDQSVKNMYNYFGSVKSQKSTIKNEKYIVLDKLTVLYTANSSWEVKLKNDSIIVMDPLGIQFLLRKVDNHWKVLSWIEEMK